MSEHTTDKDADIEALKVNKIPAPAKPARDEASRIFLPTFGLPVPSHSEVDVSEAYGGKGVKSETPIDTAAVREAIIEVLKTIFDPEIPVNIYELGLIYGVDVEPDGEVQIQMTLTAPACPVAGMLVKEVADKSGTVEGVATSHVALVWDPPWTKERMSEDALLELGML
jgi:FeS assembly SUF system protein